MPVTLPETFFKNILEEGWLDEAKNTDKIRQQRGSEARVKWLGGDSESGPWVYYAEHPVGAVANPHKHHAPRIEYIIDGEIEFFEGDVSIRWFRGEEGVSGSIHGPGTVSYVPSGQVYGYRVTKPTKLLHVFFENPIGHTEHVA